MGTTHRRTHVRFVYFAFDRKVCLASVLRLASEPCSWASPSQVSHRNIATVATPRFLIRFRKNKTVDLSRHSSDGHRK
jgi:hypothetical protein